MVSLNVVNVLEILFGLRPEVHEGVEESGAFDRDMISSSMGKSDPRPMSFKK